MEAGADVNRAKDNGQTPVYAAAIMGYVDVVKVNTET